MSIAVDPEHLALADSVRDLATAHVDTEIRRAGTAQGPAVGGQLPSAVWQALVAQGLLGLHVPESDGGEGYGPLELAVVLEQLGAVLLPGPFLPSVLTSSVLTHSDAPGAREPLRRLAAGATGAVGLDPAGLVLDRRGRGWSLHGRAVVLGGGDAQILLLPAGHDGATVWVAVEPDEVEVTAVDSFDLTRPVASVHAVDVEVPDERVLTDLDAGLVADTAVALACAEAAGIADWCLGTAAEYARTREQFGRPIGQFQGTKHRCADLLVDVERIRAVAWDASRALSDGDGTTRSLTATAAAVIGLEAAVHCAEETIQVLGGIGYTWEHDAHRFLRRAVSLRAWAGGDLDAWRRRAGAQALAGARRELRLDLGEHDETRRGIRDLVAAAAALEGQPRRDHLADHGLIAPHWPAPYGRGAGAREQLIIDEELQAAGISRPILAIGAWAVPTIIAHGTEEQRERFVRPSLTGEVFWCQLFSEPEAGSDLAALRTRAARVEGGWRLTGRKIWTSLAQMANFGICLARTDPTAPKHRGITYFLVDMASDGIEIQPIRDITGAQDFNEVVLEDVFVPDDAVVGEVDEGWSLARTTLANERVGLSDTSTWGSDVGGVLAEIRARTEAGHATGEDLHRRLGQLVCEGQTLRLLGFRITLRHLSGTDPGPTANVRKLVSMQHSRDVADAGLRLLGADGTVATGAGARWGREYLAARAYTIGGGTTEVLRNQIAERLLGLPRDP